MDIGVDSLQLAVVATELDCATPDSIASLERSSSRPPHQRANRTTELLAGAQPRDCIQLLPNLEIANDTHNHENVSTSPVNIVHWLGNPSIGRLTIPVIPNLEVHNTLPSENIPSSGPGGSQSVVPSTSRPSLSERVQSTDHAGTPDWSKQTNSIDSEADLQRTTAHNFELSAMNRVAVNLERAALPNLHRQECRPVPGTKEFSPYFHTYSGNTGSDTVLAVATGKGPNLGKSYAGGYHGSDGYITRYNAVGGCEVTATISDPAGVRITAIAVNNQGVYVVGTTNDDQSAFITKFDGNLDSPSTVAFAAPVDGTIRLSGMGISPNATAPDIFVAGRIHDPAFGLSYNTALEMSLDKTLATVRYANAVDFGADAELNSVDADRAHNAYFGGRFRDATIGDSPLTYRLNNDGLTLKWASLWTYDSSANLDLRVSVGGAKFLGGTTAASGIYYSATMGWQESLGVNPGSVTMLALKLNPIDGTFNGTTEYAFVFYSGDLNDLGGTDVTVDRNGDAYLSAYRGDPEDHDGRVFKMELATLTTTDQQNYGGAGYDDAIHSVDLVSTSPLSDLLYGGSTQTPSASATPPISSGACDPEYDGAQDGFVALAAQNGAKPPQNILTDVSFSGDKYFEVREDDGTGKYGAPHYKDNNLDGDADDEKDRKFPVAYTRDTTMKVTAKIATANPGGAVQVRADGPGNLDLPATAAAFANGVVTLPETALANKLPNTIKFYDTFDLVWEVSLDGGTTWKNVGTSRNRIYVTLADPSASPLYETVLDIGGRNAKEKDKVADAVAEIWKDFLNPIPGVKRKPVNGHNKADGAEMKFRPPQNDVCISMEDMLKEDAAQGACKAWAQLFSETLKAQGIDGAKILKVEADATVTNNAKGLLVKNWKFVQSIGTGPNGRRDTPTKEDDKHFMEMDKGAPEELCVTPGNNSKLDTPKGGDDEVVNNLFINTGADGICNSKVEGEVDDEQVIPVGNGAPNFPAIRPGDNKTLDSPAKGDDTVKDGLYAGVPGLGDFPYRASLDVFPEEGIPGQGFKDPFSKLPDHFVVKYDNKIYDPSYGTGPFDKESDHENAAIDGIRNAFGSIKKQNAAVQELKYSEVPS